MRHLGTLMLWFCTEFRYLVYGQSGLAWGAISEKEIQGTLVFLFSKYARPLFQEQVPKVDLSPRSHQQPLAIAAPGAEPLENAGGGLGSPAPRDAILS